MNSLLTQDRLFFKRKPKSRVEMKKRNYLIMTGFFILFVIGCESSTKNEPEGLEFGKFEGVVGTSQSEGLYEELGGRAWFSLNEIDSVFSFELYSDLIPDTSETRIVLSIKLQELPREGVYTFVDVDTTSQVLASGFWVCI